MKIPQLMFCKFCNILSKNLIISHFSHFECFTVLVLTKLYNFQHTYLTEPFLEVINPF